MRNLLYILILLVACESPRDEVLGLEQLRGTWLSTSYALDTDVELPFSQFMEFSDSSELRYLSGMYKDTFQPIRFMEDSIKFPYWTYPRSEVRLRDGLLHIGRTYPWKLAKVEAHELEVDSAEIKEFLLLGQWESADETMQFAENKVVKYNQQSGVAEHLCWDVYELDGYRFLQLYGNFLECKGNLRELIMIRSMEEDSMEVEMWKDGEMATLTYKKREKKALSYAEPGFRMCDPYLYEHNMGDWHHFKYAGFESGIYGLEKVFAERFRKVESGKRDGLVRVQFVINCLGEIGRLSAYSMDNDYSRVELNAEAEKQILEIMKVAGTWVPGERGGRKYDVYKYLIFRIKDGEIDEIFP